MALKRCLFPLEDYPSVHTTKTTSTWWQLILPLRIKSEQTGVVDFWPSFRLSSSIRKRTFTSACSHCHLPCCVSGTRCLTGGLRKLMSALMCSLSNVCFQISGPFVCVWYSLETTKQFLWCFPSLCGEEILSLLNHLYVSCRGFFVSCTCVSVSLC